MANNSQTVNLKGSGYALVSITGLTNATYKQHVAAFINANDGPSSQEFSGSGEGKPMKEFYTQKIQLPASVEFDFKFSKDGGATLEPASRSQQTEEFMAKGISLYKISSEDASDNDYNDTVMQMSVALVG
ncbi:fucose-binding lectin II [uncultured Kordia sp.]|uniref:fucose-binding lectin II n=1 Tax=uncultured Kordia sp. TaxID=507699 RepID=UPI0026345514|nr:fucose-binding lectin II [uncultured Kordia sp.]